VRAAKQEALAAARAAEAVCCKATELRVTLNELRCTLKDKEERAAEAVADVEAAVVRYI